MDSQSNKPPDIGSPQPQPDLSDGSRADWSLPSPPANSTHNNNNDDISPAEEDQTTAASTVANDNNIIFRTIIDQLNEYSTSDEWIHELQRKISMTRPNRMPRGWWAKIHDEYKSKFNTNCTLIQLKNLYSRAKNQATTQVMAGGASDDDQQALPVTITNAKLYIKVRDSLLNNIESMKNPGFERIRTKKIRYKDVRRDVIIHMNTAIQREGLDQKANNLSSVNDLIYACQITYDQVTTRAKSAVDWKKSIQEKISKAERQIEILSGANRSENPSQELVQMCKRRGIHSGNACQLELLKDQIEEKKAAYEKKLVIAAKRTEFNFANKMFEFNRKAFYRKLNNEKKEIAEDIDKGEVAAFWSGLWAEEADRHEDHQALLDRLDPAELQIENDGETMKKAIEWQIKGLSNWKAPGPDHVYNYFIKKLYALHRKLADIIIEAITNPELIDDEMYTGNTYLQPKVEVAREGKELRPITCLPNLYKLTSKVVTTLLTNFCDANSIISANQMGTRRACQGAKQQVLVNKVLNKAHNNGLYTSWIDVAKAYDSVDHRYLTDVLVRLNVPPTIVNFATRMLAKQRTNLICNRETIGQARIERGLLQGDALSPKLFVIALEPLSRTLNRNCEKIQLSNTESNHLIFIDDIKLLAKSEDALVELCRVTGQCLNKMSLKVNQRKSASNIDNGAVFGNKIDDEFGYKYLGVLEDGQSEIMPENKTILEKRVVDRTTQLCQTKLNAVNLFHAINEFALSSLNYYIGIVPFDSKEFDEIDRKVRRVLSEYKVTRNAANMDRLYLSRKEFGRGLACVVDKAELMLYKSYQALNESPSSRPLIEFERDSLTRLGLINEHLKGKYELTDEQINEKTIQDKQKEMRMARIKEKRMHSILFKDDDNIYDKKFSSLWLSKGNISPQQEGMLSKLQDRNLFFGGQSTKCPHCSTGKRSVEHLSTRCGGMLSFDYKKRHDEVVRCLHFQYAKMYGLNKSKKLKNYKVQNVISNERVKIKSDVPILTELRIDNNKPDLMIHDLKTNEILLIEVGITNKDSLSTTEVTKSRKYELLANELKSMYNAQNVTTVPVVMTWDGLVTKHFKRHMKRLQVEDKLVAYIQSVVLKRTCESILIDCRADQRGDWLEEEASEMMAQWESGPAEEEEFGEM